MTWPGKQDLDYEPDTSTIKLPYLHIQSFHKKYNLLAAFECSQYLKRWIKENLR